MIGVSSYCQRTHQKTAKLITEKNNFYGGPPKAVLFDLKSSGAGDYLTLAFVINNPRLTYTQAGEKITKIYHYENQFLLKIELVHYLKFDKQVTNQAKYGIL